MTRSSMSDRWLVVLWSSGAAILAGLAGVLGLVSFLHGFTFAQRLLVLSVLAAIGALLGYLLAPPLMWARTRRSWVVGAAIGAFGSWLTAVASAVVVSLLLAGVSVVGLERIPSLAGWVVVMTTWWGWRFMLTTGVIFGLVFVSRQ